MLFWGTSSLAGAVEVFESSPAFDYMDNEQAIVFMDDFIGHLFGFINALMAAILLATFGSLLSNLSHPFWSEVLFKSTLIHFKCSGTTKTTKRRVGGSIHDANSEEMNDHVTELHPQLYVTDVLTSTFAGTGGTKLRYPRFIMSMHSNDSLANELYEELNQGLSSRSSIVGMNEAEIEAIMQSNQQNLQVHATRKSIEMGNFDIGTQKSLTHEEKELLAHTDAPENAQA